MFFYRHKLVVLSLRMIAGFLSWLSYLCFVENHRRSIKDTQALTDIADQVYKVMVDNDLEWVAVKGGLVGSESLQEDVFDMLKK